MMFTALRLVVVVVVVVVVVAMVLPPQTSTIMPGVNGRVQYVDIFFDALSSCSFVVLFPAQ